MSRSQGPQALHAHGNEVHDRAATFDEAGARTGDTPNMIARIEYPYGDADAQAATARLFAASAAMRDLIAEAVPGGVSPSAWEQWRARAEAILADVIGPDWLTARVHEGGDPNGLKLCACGATLMGNERRGDTCNECLTRRVRDA